ncbi:MAG: GNAT family N-acetyltransferase [bacterium]|nr:GNAT family N-acetyltransferase [bacterium]
MEWTKGPYRISDDQSELDLFFIASALQRSYWAADRPREIVEQSIRNSLCFGLYQGDRQLGFARVVTDKCTFAWICDVVVDEDQRGAGLGKWLMEVLEEHPDVSGVGQQLLRTRDAHGLYEQFGYAVCDAMAKRPKGEPDLF